MVAIDQDPRAHHSGQAALLVWSLVWCGAAVHQLFESNRYVGPAGAVALSCVGIAMSILARPRRPGLGLRVLYLLAVSVNALVGAFLLYVMTWLM